MNSELIDPPLVSVVMPVYNAEAFLKEAIDSILTQSYRHFEFIIVDDCSQDLSAEIIRNFTDQDSRIRPVYLAQNRGTGGALNAGIAVAKGQFVARMDADDIALPERFATQVAWIRKTGIEVCGSCVKTFGVENRIMWFPEKHEAVRNEMLFRCALINVMLLAEVAKKNPYNESLYFEDYELWTRLALKHRMGNVPQVLLKYRIHPEQRHIRYSSVAREELKQLSTSYLKTVYADAWDGDEDITLSLICGEALESVEKLQRAGEILCHLANAHDNFLRKRMAQRWWSACRSSAHLGLQVYRLYRKLLPEFGTKPEKIIILQVLCGLRIKHDSSVDIFLKWIFKKMKVICQ